MTASVSSREIRRIILEQSYRANVGHIGSALSIADIISALYGRIIQATSPEHADRDRFVLSKGHAALALYAALSLRGWIDPADLNGYCADDSSLGVHPEHSVRGIDFSTGSLGQGLTFAVGAALAATMRASRRKVYVLLSDAECNEGSVWEAVMFAAQHRLANLTAIVDLNGQQALGYTKDVLEMDCMAARWRAFGWDARDVDGNDTDAIVAAIRASDAVPERPHVLVAHTVFGKGVSFMESSIPWHYLPMSQTQFDTAMAEVEAAP